MSRKGPPRRNKILPDPKFKDLVVSKFINKLMWDGKKSVAERAFYRSLEILEEKSGDEGLKQFKQALENVKPVLAR